MQSAQESVLEEFMQRSFGAQFLYVPKKFKKGNAHREPADLAWVADDFVALFYLSSSTSELAKQIEHNRKQAVGYHRLWATKNPIYALRGKNRFRDECFVSYETVSSYLTILVVSNECGIEFSQPLPSSKKNAVVVVPEALFHWVAYFGGTIVDVLWIIEKVTEMTLRPEAPEENSYSKLEELVKAYVSYALLRADPDNRYYSGVPQQDYNFIFEHLSRMKIPAALGRAVIEAKEREKISALFGDLMFCEYASLAATVEKAIEISEPPLFNKWVVLKIKTSYYSFVVGTFNFNASEVQKSFEAANDASKNGPGEVDSIVFHYGNILDINEYRVPHLIAFPKDMPRKHSAVLVESIIERSRIFSLKFTD